MLDGDDQDHSVLSEVMSARAASEVNAVDSSGGTAAATGCALIALVCELSSAFTAFFSFGLTRAFTARPFAAGSGTSFIVLAAASPFLVATLGGVLAVPCSLRRPVRPSLFASCPCAWLSPASGEGDQDLRRFASPALELPLVARAAAVSRRPSATLVVAYISATGGVVVGVPVD